MEEDLLHLDKLTGPELDSLPGEETLFLLCLSPLEIHGPHLPMGTDVRVAEGVRDRVLERIRESRPEMEVVVLPSAYLGSDTIPGSVEVASPAVYHLLMGYVRFLARRGFRYLLVLDNHGGPRHQIATAKAVRKAYRRYGFHLVAPFLLFYRRMVELDPGLVERVGRGKGECGDVQDCHAGLNETSLMLAVDGKQVRPSWKELPRTGIDAGRWPARLAALPAALLRRVGAERAADDLEYLGLMLCWVTEKNPPTYIGEPGAASARAGERMLEAFADQAMELVERALAGEPPYHTPLGWTLRFLEASR
jgi:creatinine amidohydrolase/Fe(II)-dependent formamide hydrolase-like protein